MDRISPRSEVVITILVFGGLALTVVLGEAGVRLVSGPRLILTLLVVLVAPGYFWHVALFPRQSSLEGWERSAMVIGLSAASVPPLAIVLDGALRVPLRIETILASITVWTGLGILAANARRQVVPRADRFGIRLTLARLAVPLRRDRIGALLIASFMLTTVVSALALLLTFTAEGPARSFTEFYVLGNEALAENYPRALRVGAPTLLTTTVVNEEDHATYFMVIARIGDQILGQSEPVTVAPGTSADLSVSVIPLFSDTDVPLDLDLMREDQAGAYRRLRLWVDVLPRQE